MPEKDNSVDYSKMRFSSLGGKTIVQDKDVNSGNNKKFSDLTMTKPAGSFKFNPAMEQRILAAKDRQSMRQQARARRLSGGSERIESQFLPTAEETYINRRGKEKKSKLYKHNLNVQERINKGLPQESKTGIGSEVFSLKKLKPVSTGGLSVTQSNINNTPSPSLSNISGANTLPKTESDYANPSGKTQWDQVGLTSMVKEREKLKKEGKDTSTIQKLITDTRAKYKI